MLRAAKEAGAGRRRAIPDQASQRWVGAPAIFFALEAARGQALTESIAEPILWINVERAITAEAGTALNVDSHAGDGIRRGGLPFTAGRAELARHTSFGSSGGWVAAGTANAQAKHR